MGEERSGMNRGKLSNNKRGRRRRKSRKSRRFPPSPPVTVPSGGSDVRRGDTCNLPKPPLTRALQSDDCHDVDVGEHRFKIEE